MINMDLKKEDLLKIRTFQDIVFLAIKPSFLDKLEVIEKKVEKPEPKPELEQMVDALDGE